MNAYVTQTKDFDSSENVPAVKAHFGFSFTPTRTRDPGLSMELPSCIRLSTDLCPILNIGTSYMPAHA